MCIGLDSVFETVLDKDIDRKSLDDSSRLGKSFDLIRRSKSQLQDLEPVAENRGYSPGPNHFFSPCQSVASPVCEVSFSLHVYILTYSQLKLNLSTGTRNIPQHSFKKWTNT